LSTDLVPRAAKVGCISSSFIDFAAAAGPDGCPPAVTLPRPFLSISKFELMPC
jgi:hypothetical protein